jgi:hypothetical protein
VILLPALLVLSNMPECQCGGRYYVLDGLHRIAVARPLGERSVWANVTEVRLNQPDPPRSG